MKYNKSKFYYNIYRKKYEFIYRERISFYGSVFIKLLLIIIRDYNRTNEIMNKNSYNVNHLKILLKWMWLYGNVNDSKHVIT